MRRILGLLLWVSLAATAGPVQTSPWTLQQLMASLAAVKTVNATFREQKELAILQKPLVMTGMLRYRSPAYLKKQTLQPQAESYEADEDWLVIETPEGERRQFSLNGYPLIRVFVEAIRATLAGDLPTLERYYQVQLQGQAADWRLRLVPVDKEISEYVSSIIIGGQGNRVLSIETLETGGDRSLMTIEPHNE
jgi:outer membrane lipoprotein-sorting protein